MNRNYIEDDIGFIELVDKMTNDTALKVVNAARISHGKSKEEFDEKDQKLVKYLWQHEHTSPFRHTYYTFHIKAPLFVFNQWKKYQIGSTWMSNEMYDTDKGCSWNEVSGRYTQLKPEFFIPKTFRTQSKENKQGSVEANLDHQFYANHMAEITDYLYRQYLQLIDRGIAKEQARLILPQNIYSESYWTVSLQAVLHFLHQRLKPEAQYEIRMYAERIKFAISEDLDRLGISEI
jgi:thymidylate synthase (FAD)